MLDPAPGPTPEVVAAIDAMVAALPTVSLHCHLIGTVAPQTVVGLATKHDVPVGGRSAEDLYDHASYEDLGAFLRVLDGLDPGEKAALRARADELVAATPDAPPRSSS